MNSRVKKKKYKTVERNAPYMQNSNITTTQEASNTYKLSQLPEYNILLNNSPAQSSLDEKIITATPTTTSWFGMKLLMLGNTIMLFLSFFTIVMLLVKIYLYQDMGLNSFSNNQLQKIQTTQTKSAPSVITTKKKKEISYEDIEFLIKQKRWKNLAAIINKEPQEIWNKNIQHLNAEQWSQIAPYLNPLKRALYKQYNKETKKDENYTPVTDTQENISEKYEEVTHIVIDDIDSIYNPTWNEQTKQWEIEKSQDHHTL